MSARSRGRARRRHARHGGGSSLAELLANYDILRVRAPNPGPLTLYGHQHLGGRRGARLGHRPRAAARRRTSSGCGGHRGARRARRRRRSPTTTTTTRGRRRRCSSATRRRVAAGAGPSTCRSREGARFGPLRGRRHARARRRPLRALASGACFTGDAVLGDGSVFISPYRGAMSGYLLALTRAAAARGLQRAVPRPRAARVGRARQARGIRQPPHRSREPPDRGARRRQRAACASCSTRSGRTCPSSCARWPQSTLAAHLDKLEDEQIAARRRRAPERSSATEW